MLASSLGICNRNYQYDEKYWGLFSSFHFESSFKLKLSLKNIVEAYKDLKKETSSSIFVDVEKLNIQMTQNVLPLLYNSHITQKGSNKLKRHIYPIHEPLSQKNGRFLCYPNDFIFTPKAERENYVAELDYKFISFDIIEASVAISRYFFKYFSVPISDNLYEHFEEKYNQPKHKTKTIVSAYIFGASQQKVARMIKGLDMIGNIMQAHFWHDLTNMIQRKIVYHEIEDQIEKKGFLKTMNKRAKFFTPPELLSAWSYIVHGNESDIIINSLIDINKKYPDLNIPIINGDEIIIHTKNMSLEQEIKEIIERNGSEFNIKVKTKVGNNWLEATE